MRSRHKTKFNKKKKSDLKEELNEPRKCYNCDSTNQTWKFCCPLLLDLFQFIFICNNLHTYTYMFTTYIFKFHLNNAPKRDSIILRYYSSL